MTDRTITKRQIAKGAPGKLGRLSGPPLIVQFIGLVVGALIAAQLATLLLTIILPPAPPREYALADIAAALRNADAGGGRFDRLEQSGPPDLSARGWFVSETSRAKLAKLLDRPIDQVALGFYTQLPVGGEIEPVAAPTTLPSDAQRQPRRVSGVVTPARPGEPGNGLKNVALAFSNDGGTFRLTTAMLFQQMPGGPPSGGPPGGGFPGAGQPGGGFPQSLPPPPPPQNQPRTQPQMPPPQPSAPPQTSRSTPPAAPQSQPPAGNSTGPQGPAAPAPTSPGASPPLNGAVTPGSSTPFPNNVPAPLSPGLSVRPIDTPTRSPTRTPGPTASQRPATVPTARPPAAELRPGAQASGEPGGNTSLDTTTASEPSPSATPVARIQSEAPAPVGRPVPITRPTTSLFGLAPSPFVEGDFIAATRETNGSWIVVSPRAEGFPNAWQRRVALWFLLSLLAVAPIAWLFARRIVGPLNDFAHAADVLGRDPGAAVLPLDGPAEIGRAAHAFNQMQSRLRSFVDDRTAMIGAISHDLRTPLTRLRFRIEDVPDDQQDDLRGEVAEMEDMITSVISFIRDASIPNARERRDLAEIVDDVVEDATLLGDVTAGRVESAIVDVDPLGIRRVLNNLLTNAMKYGGGHARVILHVEDGCAVADIIDNGPGVPDAELERIFEPFYRSEAARTSDREGSGLGLAVCRSIARAHGGDVALFKSVDGFTARVTLPLAYNDKRRAA